MKIQDLRLRTGLISAWADEFIQYMFSEGIPPFEMPPINLCHCLIDRTLFGGHDRPGCMVYYRHFCPPVWTLPLPTILLPKNTFGGGDTGTVENVYDFDMKLIS